MNEAAHAFITRISSGLKRQSVTDASRWAMAYRVMGTPYPGPWTFKYHPWLKAMHDSKAERNVGQKSAQMGFTETVLNLVFYHIDVLGVNCLYVLPAAKPDATDFSASRFDPALELSAHLMSMFSDVKNIGHKRAGTTNLYIRGSRSRAGLKSVPVGLIILDEVDEMTQKNIPLAFERSSGQLLKLQWLISTATLPNYGINKYFNESTQEHFFFRCPHCSKFIEMKFPESIVITSDDIANPDLKNSHYICTECKLKLAHEDKAIFLNKNEWVAQNPGRDSRGFYINQMYSTTITPYDFASAYIYAQKDEAAEQEFYNSKLGLAHQVAGARLVDEQITSCLGNYVKLSQNDRGLITMGIDVGKWLHIEIDSWILNGAENSADMNALATPRVIWYGKVTTFEEAYELVSRFGIHYTVLDALPETRKSEEFCARFHGRAKMCYYGRSVKTKTKPQDQEESYSITVNRTAWLDLSLGRFKRGKKGIQIPRDINTEYRDHLKALVRLPEKDADGQMIVRYVQVGEHDHYAHARNYAEIAFPLAMNLSISSNTQSPI